MVFLDEEGHVQRSGSSESFGAGYGLYYSMYVTNDVGTVNFEKPTSGCCAHIGLNTLAADNVSEITAFVPGVTNVTWGFLDDTLDCRIRSGTNGTAIVTAGNKEGVVTVTANDSGCVYQGKLALVQGCGSSSCESGTCDDFGSGGGGNHSVDFRFGLGKDSVNYNAGSGGYGEGFIALKSVLPNTTLCTPEALTALYPGSSSDWRWNTNGALRQVNTPQGLVDIIVNNDHQYDLNFYYASDVGDLTDGLYTLNTGAEPFVTWTVEFPGGADDTNHVQITETRGSSVITNLYTWVDDNDGWILDRGNFLRRDTRVVSWTTNTFPVRTETLLTYNSTNGSLVAVTTNVYTVYNWGEALTQATAGQDANAKTTTYTLADTNGLLLETDYPNGSWEKYAYDGSGRVINKYASFLNQAPTTDSSLCRVTEYDYTPVGTGDDGTVRPNSPRKIVELVTDKIVSLSYAVYQPNLDIQIRCVRTNADWSDSDNLFTTNRYDELDRLTNSVSPDGTLQVLEYATNSTNTQLTNTVYVGQPNGSFTAVTDGTETISIYGSLGELIARTNLDIASTRVLSSENYTYTDDLKRSYTVVYLDGTSNSVSYGCCGIDSTVDRDGAATGYAYDDLKRQIASTRLGITTTHYLDGSGNEFMTTRTGSNGPPITLRTAEYNVAGELIRETNALNGVTSYTNIVDGSGQTIKTNIYPDGGTRIETYFRDGSLASVIGTAVHAVRYEYGVESEGGVYRAFTKEIKLNSTYADTSEWTKTYSDLLGRAYKTVYASESSTPAALSYYNLKGQLTNQVDPDGVSTIYAYNGKGEQTYTVVDMDRNGNIDWSGSDRITFTTNDVVSDHGVNVLRTRTYVWDTLDSNVSNLVSTVETSTDGLRTWQTRYRDASTLVTNRTVTSYGTGGSRTVTAVAPDGSYTISLYSYGRLVSIARYDSGDGLMGTTTYGYDSHGRQSSITDPRNGTTYYDYNDADLIDSVTTPNPGGLGGVPQTTYTYYNKSLQVTNVVQPDGTTVTSEYYLTGELKRNYGSRIYPVAYSYDYAGRMKTMTNWSSFIASGSSSGARVTSWNYNSYRGWLDSKDYPDPDTGNPPASAGTTGPTYTYTDAGRLHTRVWLRGVTTTYLYGNAGDLTNVVYTDSTPGVTNTYDRLGRKKTVVCNGMTDTLAYDSANDLLSETFSGGILDGLAVTNDYDAYLRRTAFGLNTQPSTVTQFDYDNASRLEGVTNGSDTAAYTYLDNSSLIGQITYAHSGATKMTTTKSYDYLNRLTQISSSPSGASAVSFTYNYNNANQRVRSTLADGSYWLYQYGSLGQLQWAHKFFSDETPVPGQQFDYNFDSIGNRTSAEFGGDANGGNLRTISYDANSLNQYTSILTPGYKPVFGVAIATNAVTVNGNAAFRKVEYFESELSLANGSGPVWQNVSVNAGGSNVTGNILFPPYDQSPLYDSDGNLTNDGLWDYTWDAENRLISIASVSAVPDAAKRELDFAYDPQGRRIQKAVSTNNGSVYVPEYTNTFVYDGWNLIAELGPSGSLIRSYVWGTDLSGTMQGAGGVGGLLVVSYHGNSTTNCFPAFDGNGNVAAYINAADGTSLAQFDYDPFLNVIRATGPMATLTPFLGSTKYYDWETRLYYYGYRYYGPSWGAWPSRDPIEEEGALNLHGFVNNDPTVAYDILGASTYDFDKHTYYRAISLVAGDLVISGGSHYSIVSGNLVPFASGSNLAKIACLLAKLGFTLPTPKFPAYLANFNDGANAWTLSYGIPRKRFTMFDVTQINKLNTVNAQFLAVTVWHEIVGHNINNEEDGNAFNLKYEQPVIDAITKFRKNRLVCGRCEVEEGDDWYTRNEFEVFMCRCGINPPRKASK